MATDFFILFVFLESIDQLVTILVLYVNLESHKAINTIVRQAVLGT
jgi:hypothetical protein